MKIWTLQATITPLLSSGLLSHSRGLRQIIKILMQEKTRDVSTTTLLKVSIP